MVLLVCGVILGINVYLINAKSLVGDQLPMPFGIGGAIVLSGSMEPSYSVGDLILVKETQDLAIDDVVVYQQSGSLIVHRVVALDGTTVTTKGDANDVADTPISLADIKGKVFAKIPVIGRWIGLIKTPIGTIAILAVAIALVEVPRRWERKKDEEERQKIINEILELKQKEKNTRR